VFVVPRKLGPLAAVAAMTVAALAALPADSAERLDLEARIDSSGNGQLSAKGSGPWSWEACDPKLIHCESVGGGREIKTRGAPAGTVFRVKSRGIWAVSPEWRGRVTSLRPPAAEGVVQANDFISPSPGGWAGGWEGELSLLQLAACATAEGQNCITLTDPRYVRNCAPSASFGVDARFTGKYLRVADRRIGVGPPLTPASAISSPNGGHVWARSRTTSIAVVGTIQPALSAPSGECGPPPRNDAVISPRGVARITCQGGCHAALVARAEGWHARVARRVPEQNALIAGPPLELEVPSRFAGTKRVRLVVRVDGKQLAQKTVSLRGRTIQ